MTLAAQELAYHARALAQAHPLTALAKSYLDRAVAEQRTSQPVPEIGVWAGAALLTGYCVRCVEEEDAGIHLQPVADAAPELDKLDEMAGEIAAHLRTDQASAYMIGDEERTIDALDKVIHSEISRRVDHWRESIDDAATAELEEYIAWWVVKGYALRVAESTSGAVA